MFFGMCLDRHTRLLFGVNPEHYVDRVAGGVDHLDSSRDTQSPPATLIVSINIVTRYTDTSLDNFV